MINSVSEKTLKQIITAIACCAGMAFGIANAQETAPTEDPDLWDKTKETSSETWDATKEGSAKAWDATKEGSGKAWDATKEGSAKSWDATKEVFTDSDTPEETPANGNPQQ